MKQSNKLSLGAFIAAASLSSGTALAADSFTEALTSGKAKVDTNLRYESVEQDNAREDATAVTLRTRIGYATGSYNGFSAFAEMEDSRVAFGQDEYSSPGSPDTTTYSVIADPENTEVDQAFLQYKNDVFTGKLGRQVITMDNHRFVGHVGWRQDRQTFDALTLSVAPAKEWSINYSYLGQRNRIFGEALDIQSKDHLFNVGYTTPVGKITGYSYMLEVDNDTDNALDTLGLRFAGATKVSDALKLSYTVEFATQESTAGATEKDADYTLLELGLSSGTFSGMIGYEILGSDEGTYGFSTPLATLHKFNGWADVFLATPGIGLVDTYISLGAKINGGKGGSITAIYHSFSADESGTGSDDLGSEIDFVYGLKFGKIYSFGIKAAMYDAGDAGGKVDTDKTWIWLGASF